VSPALQQYIRLLLEWNQTVNLTAAKTREQVEAQIAQAAGLQSISWRGVQRAIDIGSGGGLPAIPLALSFPDTEFSLLEANGRKTAFLEHVAGSLGLANVRVLPGRAEELGRQPALRERFDRAISRAAAPPAVLLELALPFVRTGGGLFAEVASLDPQRLAHAAGVLGGGPPRIEQPSPGGSALLVVDKLAPTPATFPRRTGLPNRRPLT
jgi:16S rRNA (guanine527-N7)-methyltransferase